MSFSALQFNLVQTGFIWNSFKKFSKVVQRILQKSSKHLGESFENKKENKPSYYCFINLLLDIKILRTSSPALVRRPARWIVELFNQQQGLQSFNRRVIHPLDSLNRIVKRRKQILWWWWSKFLLAILEIPNKSPSGLFDFEMNVITGRRKQ